MANTYVDYVGSDGTGTDGKEFAFSFPYIKTSHVVVEINQGPAGGTNKWERTTAFTVSTSPSTRVVLDSTPNSLWKIRVLRDSDANVSLVDFANGSVLTETELDNAYLHNRYLAEEAEEGVSGGTISKNDDGQFNADGLRLENLADPDSDDDAVNKGYADTRFVNVTGDTMSGALTLPNTDPTNDDHAARKKYVDDEVADEASARVANDALQVTKAGDSMSGNLTMTSPAKVIQNQAPTSGDDLTNKTYVDNATTTLTNDKVSKSGDTMTGALTLPEADPSSENHATRKRYVDQQIAVAVSSGTPGGPIETANIDDGAITTAKIDDGAVTTAKIEDDAVTFAKMQNISTAKVIGRTTAGSGDPEEVTILDEDDMTSDSETSLATQQSIKAYVDGAVGGVTGATNLGQTLSNTSVEITSSTGDNTTIAGAVASGNAGVMTGADKALLDTAVQPNDNISTLNNDSGFTANAGTVTQVSTGTGLTGGPITGTGTIGISNGGVDTDQLADNAVTAAKISDTDTTFNIDSSGNVGVGIAPPQGGTHIAKLYVSGTGNTYSAVSSNTMAGIDLDHTGAGTNKRHYQMVTLDGKYEIRQMDDDLLNFTTPLQIDTNGDIVITGDIKKGGNVLGVPTVYTSSETSIPATNTTQTWTHSLGQAPDLIQLILKCKIAEHGYSVGDEVRYTSEYTAASTYNLWATSTQIGLRGFITSGASIFHLVRRDTTGALTQATPANWKIVVKGIVF